MTSDTAAGRTNPSSRADAAQQLTYADAGVDIDAGERATQLVKPLAVSTRRPEVIGGIGFFGGLFELGEYEKPVLVSSTDSVGTKVVVLLNGWLFARYVYAEDPGLFSDRTRVGGGR